MNIMYFLNFFMVLTIACGNQVLFADDGGMTGGGGDNLRLRFLDGQELAVSIIDAIDESSLAADTSSEAKAWILQNQKDWLADVRATKQIWSDQHGHETCAWTEFSPRAQIQLSFYKCSRVGDESSVAFILLHESVHHLGIKDESMADSIAKAAIDAWRLRTLTSIPLCTDPMNILADRIFGEWEPDIELTLRMLGEVPSSLAGGRLKHTKDLSVLKFFPGIGKCAYTAGWFEADVPALDNEPAYHAKTPFVLVDINGNPAILFDEDDFFGQRAGRQPRLDVITELHRGFRMLGKGATPERDILFVGGDNNNQPLYPFKRAQPK
jgi:hypothetical protein